ncbi:hypothetical protein FVE85_5481 [Porphyridium purpureum]|uniref:Leishmanolysin-like peptidase n=1 Tax=Porphyridium purpureum TaxID=35688 RepID=A0A5J4Z2P0_PORPP|nr:hypothetical protein FVE85_5481 [Porphyridium purpureum]|eukprot:POR4478..scf295_1
MVRVGRVRAALLALLCAVILGASAAAPETVPVACDGDCYPFTINLVPNGAQDPRVVEIFEEAHATLRRVLVGQRLVAQPVEMSLYFRVNSIDGLGGVLGSSRNYQHIAVCTDDEVPCHYDVLPSLAECVFDAADFFSNCDFPAWKDFWVEVVLHEMLHVLGVGSFWTDRFPTRTGYNTRVDCVATSSASYKYPGAKREWNLLGGSGAPPVEYNHWNGDGSNCKHWDESKMNVELMTSEASTVLTPSTVSTVERLSKVTLGAMEDLNYVVDWSQAEAYIVPPSPQLAELETQTQTLESVHNQGQEYLAELELSEEARRKQIQRATEREELHTGLHRGVIGEVWYPETYKAPLLDRTGRIIEQETIGEDLAGNTHSICTESHRIIHGHTLKHFERAKVTHHPAQSLLYDEYTRTFSDHHGLYAQVCDTDMLRLLGAKSQDATNLRTGHGTLEPDPLR